MEDWLFLFSISACRSEEIPTLLLLLLLKLLLLLMLPLRLLHLPRDNLPVPLLPSLL